MKWQHRALFDKRGVSAVEYALVLVLILAAVGVGYKALGKNGQRATRESDKAFSGETAEPVATASPSGKSSVAVKMSLDGAARARTAFVSSVKTKINDTTNDFDFSFKKLLRWFAIAIGALGAGVAFSVYKRGKAEATTAAAIDPDVTGPPPPGTGTDNSSPIKYTD